MDIVDSGGPCPSAPANVKYCSKYCNGFYFNCLFVKTRIQTETWISIYNVDVLMDDRRASAAGPCQSSIISHKLSHELLGSPCNYHGWQLALAGASLDALGAGNGGIEGPLQSGEDLVPMYNMGPCKYEWQGHYYYGRDEPHVIWWGPFYTENIIPCWLVWRLKQYQSCPGKNQQQAIEPTVSSG